MYREIHSLPRSQPLIRFSEIGEMYLQLLQYSITDLVVPLMPTGLVPLEQADQVQLLMRRIDIRLSSYLYQGYSVRPLKAVAGAMTCFASSIDGMT